MPEYIPYHLIHKDLSGSISASEKRALSDWLDQSFDHREIQREVIDVWNEVGDYKPNVKFSAKKGFKKFKKDIAIAEKKNAFDTAPYASIIQEIKGEASPKEIEAVQSWSVASSPNMELKKDIEDIWDKASEYKSDVKFSAKKAFKRFKEDISAEEMAKAASSVPYAAIIQDITGGADQIEKETVQSWSTESPSNADLKEEIADIWNKAGEYKPEVKFSGKKAFKRFKKEVISKEPSVPVEIPYSLMHKSVSKDISAEEGAELSEWLSKSFDHQDMMQEVGFIWGQSSEYTPDTSFDARTAFMKFKTSVIDVESTQEIEKQPVSKLAVVRDTEEETVVKDASDRSKLQPKVIRMRPGRRMISSAAAFLCLLAAGAWGWNSFFEYEVLTTGENETLAYTLPDNSKVWLNEQSTFKFPKRFSTGDRNVKLEGEAYFDVSKREGSTFTVSTDQSTVTVLGTEFHVDETVPGEVQVTVDEGKVRLGSDKTTSTVELTVGEIGRLSLKDGNLIESMSDDPSHAAWKKGKLSIKSQSLSEVIETLSSYYEVEIKVLDQSLMGLSITSHDLTGDSFNEVLNILQNVWPEVDFDRTAPGKYTVSAR